MADDRLGEPSAAIRGRVEGARERQARRFSGTNLLTNSDMGPAEVQVYCGLDDAGRSLLKAAMVQHPEGTRMTARAYHRILKLARMIADPSSCSGQVWRGATAFRPCILRLAQDRPGGGDPVPAEAAGIGEACGPWLLAGWHGY